MYRTSKKLAILFAVILLWGLGTNHISSYALTENYNTTTVKRDNLIIEVTAKVDPFFLNDTSITFDSPYGNATFVKYLVKQGDVVTEGQDIAEIKYSVDDIELAKLNIDLKKAEDNYKDYITRRDNELKELKEAVNNAADATAKQIAKLMLEKKTMQYAASDENNLANVEAIREKIANANVCKEITTIKAKNDGIIGWLQRRNANSSIHDGSYMGAILAMDEMYFALGDPNSIIRYGMKVKLIDEAGNEYAAHTVTCCSNVLSDEVKSKTAYFMPDDDLSQVNMWNMTVKYETMHLENVIIIPSGAVKTDKRGSYVRELANGAVYKRYFTLGKTVKDKVYAADGLSEGMTIIVD